MAPRNNNNATHTLLLSTQAVVCCYTYCCFCWSCLLLMLLIDGMENWCWRCQINVAKKKYCLWSLLLSPFETVAKTSSAGRTTSSPILYLVRGIWYIYGTNVSGEHTGSKQDLLFILPSDNVCTAWSINSSVRYYTQNIYWYVCSPIFTDIIGSYQVFTMVPRESDTIRKLFRLPHSNSTKPALNVNKCKHRLVRIYIYIYYYISMRKSFHILWSRVV